MGWQEIEIPCGDYREIDFVVKDEDGSYVNLEGKNIRFVVKESLDDEDASALINKAYPGSDDIVPVAPAQGWVKVIVWPGETRLTPKTYLLELKVLDGSKVFTVTQAKMRITPVVWRGD